GYDPTSEILKVVNHFIFMPEDSQERISQKKRLIYRWILGIPAALFGEISELILVLIGHKGNGKTEFYKNILPPELAQFHTVNGLNRGKDSDILLTEKLIINLDEWESIDKKVLSLLKTLASARSFSVRRPYGKGNVDLKRMTLLCGTSNQDEVIYDNSGGNRRIFPIKIKGRDFEFFDAIDKELLLCQLCHLWKARKDKGKHVHKLTKDEQEDLDIISYAHYQSPPETEYVSKYIIEADYDKEGNPIGQANVNYFFMTATDVSDYIQAQVQLRITKEKVGRALKFLGFKRVQERRGSMPTYGYYISAVSESEKGKDTEERRKKKEFYRDREERFGH
ncbi:MAG: hypothetical protein ACJA01_003084, partial [Saprospiraceae bacterium]